jgi:hypothetical protein
MHLPNLMMTIENSWWHILVNPTKQKKNITCMKGNALQLFGLFHHFGVIFTIAHLGECKVNWFIFVTQGFFVGYLLFPYILRLIYHWIY